MASIPLVGALLVGSTAVLWVGSSLLEKASEQLGELYGLPPVVQGSVVIAIGSSFPELATALLATAVHGSFALGLGVIVGSAVFNVLVIPGLSAIVSGEMRTSRALVFKEGLSYLVAVLGLALILAMAAVYNPVADTAQAGLFTRPLAVAPLILYGFYLALQWADASDEETPEDVDGNRPAAWGRLVAGLALVLVAAEGLIRGVLAVSGGIGVSPLVWGVTLIALATSLPDAFASLAAARRDRSLASLANALGSNTFDLLVVVPVGVLVAGTEQVDLAGAGPLFFALLAATLMLLVFLRTDLALTRREGTVLLGAYGVFLVAVLEAAGLVGLA